MRVSDVIKDSVFIVGSTNCFAQVCLDKVNVVYNSHARFPVIENAYVNLYKVSRSKQSLFYFFSSNSQSPSANFLQRMLDENESPRKRLSILR